MASDGPETFDFLDFTHCCAKNKSGGFMLKRTTNKKRMAAKLREVKTELMRRRHLPIPEQGRWLASVVQGHLTYYTVPGNIDTVVAFQTQATPTLVQGATASKPAHESELGADGPPLNPMAPTRPHHASLARHAVRRQNPRQEPSAVILHAGICAGGRLQGGPYRDNHKSG